jgi:hypothetical protein
MAGRKISINRDESRDEAGSGPDVATGGNGEVPAEVIRPNEGAASSVEEGIFDPGKLDSSADTGDSSGEEWFPKRNKRGRKPKVSKETASDLNGLLWMIHAGLSELTGVEELLLDPKESEELSKAIARVQAFYPTSILSPIAMAWTGLIVTAGKVYGTRVIAYTARKKRKPSVVTEIPLPPGTAVGSVTP